MSSGWMVFGINKLGVKDGGEYRVGGRWMEDAVAALYI